MKDDLFRYPTFDEMRALETAARRARAQEVARLLRAGAQALKSPLARAVEVLTPRGIRHA